MKELKFNNPVFHEGLNLTTRRGTKWASVDDLVTVTGGRSATVNYVKVMRFKDVFNEDLLFEHDPECRTYEGLLLEMRKVYTGFTESEIVTLIFFTLLN